MTATKTVNSQKRLNLSQAYFNPLLLFFYDWIVYSIVSKYIWGCSVELLLSHYRALLDSPHLEVGVGTGYLLDRLDPVGKRIDLMDLSDSCLAKAGARLARFEPDKIKHNILEPYPEDEANRKHYYSSICLNYVLHCVPGSFKDKSIALGNLKTLLTKDGIIFGATVVAKNNNSSKLAQLAMRVLNRMGIFNNSHDDPKKLKSELAKYYQHVDVTVISSTAFFIASDYAEKFDACLNRISSSTA